MRLPRKIKKRIPEGPYCYEYTGKTSTKWSDDFNMEVTVFHTRVCPFYFTNRLGFGDCKYLLKKWDILNGEGDDIDLCLDDQCKSCNFKKG